MLPSQPPARGSALLQHRALLPRRSLRCTVSTSTLVAITCPLLLPQSTLAETPGPCSCIAHRYRPHNNSSNQTVWLHRSFAQQQQHPSTGVRLLSCRIPHLWPSLARSACAEQPPRRQHFATCLCHSDQMAAPGERSAIVAAAPQTPRVDAPTTGHTAIARVARTRTPNHSPLQALVPCPWKETLL